MANPIQQHGVYWYNGQWEVWIKGCFDTAFNNFFSAKRSFANRPW